MLRKNSVVLYPGEEDYKLEVEAMTVLRKLFLEMPFEQFVNVEELRRAMPENKAVYEYLICVYMYLDFGIDSFRYHMPYLSDAKTVEVADRGADHDIHTDMWGRSRNNKMRRALGFAMGFQRFSEESGVEELGCETDPGCAEETVSTELGDVQILGLRNANGNLHGYCLIKQWDGTRQYCFFNDGKILARRVEYANGMGEDVHDNQSLVMDLFADRTAYELCDASDDDCSVVLGDGIALKKVAIARETAKTVSNTLSGYSLKMVYRHYVEYPYDEGEWETEQAECTPNINMAVLGEGKLIGVLFKTNGYTLISVDSEKRSRSSWRNCMVGPDEETTVDGIKLSLKKKERS